MEKIHKISLRKYLENENEYERKKFNSRGIIATTPQKDSKKALTCLENMLDQVEGDVAFEAEIHSTKEYFFFTKYFATAEAYKFMKYQ